ncbi:MAG: glycosyltransferase [Bacteroidota bacterium]
MNPDISISPASSVTSEKAPKSMFIAWVPYQRRSESLAHQLGIDLRYYHYKWEVKSKFHKAWSYVLKFSKTLGDLFRERPDLVFMQLAPTPVLYASAIYKLFTGADYIADCHNTMIFDGHWVHWPFAKSLMRKSRMILVHNNDVLIHTEKLRFNVTVLRDPVPEITVDQTVKEVAGVQVKDEPYIIVPCSFDVDEPIEELFEACHQCPEIKFMTTWYHERLPQEVKDQAPENIIFTGFLPENEFSALYAHANGAIVLTTREGTQPSGASEALSLHVPLIVSDIETTRGLYGSAAVFVDNNAESIAAGAKEAVANFSDYQQKMATLKQAFVKEIGEQINLVRRTLGL